MNLLSVVALFISLFLGLVAPSHSPATELSTAATNLAPGAWAQLSSPQASFFRQGSSISTLDAMGEGTWDPVTRRVYFMAAARFGSSKLHVYDDGTNSWKEGGGYQDFLIPPGVMDTTITRLMLAREL